MLSLHNVNSYTTMHYIIKMVKRCLRGICLSHIYFSFNLYVSGSSTGGGEVGVGMGVDQGVLHAWGLSDHSVSKVKYTTCYITGGCRQESGTYIQRGGCCPIYVTTIY